MSGKVVRERPSSAQAIKTLEWCPQDERGHRHFNYLKICAFRFAGMSSSEMKSLARSSAKIILRTPEQQKPWLPSKHVKLNIPFSTSAISSPGTKMRAPSMQLGRVLSLLLFFVLPFSSALKFDLLAHPGGHSNKERCIRNFVGRDTLVLVTAIVGGQKGDGQLVNMQVRSMSWYSIMLPRVPGC